MTIEDESQLTAYLDGELDPFQRLSLESALSTDPELVERLLRLAALRELIAGLPRPAPPVDLSGAIVEQIGRRPRRRLTGPLGALALAASVLLAVGLALQSGRPARRPRRPLPTGALVASKAGQTVTTTPTIEDREETAGASETPRVPSTEGAASLVRASASDGRSHTGEADTEADRARAAGRIRAMLDSPNLHRVFIVIDEMGGGARDRVDELVQKTPRTEASYGRITVSQGIVIDPRHPNEATVFALVMNDQELRHFERKLEQSLPGHVEPTGADPEVVTQLADIGQVAVLSGTTASAVDIPDADSSPVALRTDVNPQETLRLSSEFNLPAAAEIDRNGNASDRAANAGAHAGTSGAAPRHRATGLAHSSASSSAPARGDVPPATDEPLGGPADANAPAGRRDVAIARNPRLHAPPGIVLVWVTSR